MLDVRLTVNARALGTMQKASTENLYARVSMGSGIWMDRVPSPEPSWSANARNNTAFIADTGVAVPTFTGTRVMPAGGGETRGLNGAYHPRIHA